MQKVVCFVIGFLLLACSKKAVKLDLSYLNGYWEIEKVSFPDGSSKDYKANTSVDYMEITDTKGFRKKVQPMLNGTYATSDDAEFFTVLEKNGFFEFHYKNDLSEWEERLTSLSKDRFSVINKDNVTFTYKKYEPINVME